MRRRPLSEGAYTAMKFGFRSVVDLVRGGGRSSCAMHQGRSCMTARDQGAAPRGERGSWSARCKFDGCPGGCFVVIGVDAVKVEGRSASDVEIVVASPYYRSEQVFETPLGRCRCQHNLCNHSSRKGLSWTGRWEPRPTSDQSSIALKEARWWVIHLPRAVQVGCFASSSRPRDTCVCEGRRTSSKETSWTERK
jgi:hypothetical protein